FLLVLDRQGIKVGTETDGPEIIIHMQPCNDAVPADIPSYIKTKIPDLVIYILFRVFLPECNLGIHMHMTSDCHHFFVSCLYLFCYVHQQFVSFSKNLNTEFSMTETALTRPFSSMSKLEWWCG